MSSALSLKPANVRELSEQLAAAGRKGVRISSVDLREMNRILDYAAADMVVTVEAGITLAALQTELKRRQQWLPIDPPRSGHTSIGAILAVNASGPRRFGYGTVRDWLIGMRVVLADGTEIKTGGKVVKNVAGYDLAKLLIGGRASLGVIVEASFKLRPLPEREVFVQRRFASVPDAIASLEAVARSRLSAVALDLHNLARHRSALDALSLVLGLAGAGEDVEEALKEAATIGIDEPGDLHHEELFWSGEGSQPIGKRSVLPSRLGEILRDLENVPFVARAGNGIVYYRGGAVTTPPDLSGDLARRLKQAFDPGHVFPDLNDGGTTIL